VESPTLPSSPTAVRQSTRRFDPARGPPVRSKIWGARPTARAFEPTLFPRLRIHFADFPEPLSPID